MIPINNRVTPEKITNVSINEMFVFGSNESGIHGAGAAKTALSFGARLGQGFGPSGNTFAIPTKDWKVQTLPLDIIGHYVESFACFAKDSQSVFLVTPIGCGLAGYTAEDIAPLFRQCIYLDNIYLPKVFWDLY